MSDKKYNKDDCLILLQNKYRELQAEGLDRYPQRSDFEELEVVAIKAFFGPWPRALEEAGIKPSRDDDRVQKNKEKRIRAKRARIASIKNSKQEKKNSEKQQEFHLCFTSLSYFEHLSLDTYISYESKSCKLNR